MQRRVSVLLATGFSTVMLCFVACGAPASGREFDDRCPSGIAPDSTGCPDCYATPGDPCTPGIVCVHRLAGSCRAEVACGETPVWTYTRAGLDCCESTPGCVIETLDAHFADDASTLRDAASDARDDGDVVNDSNGD